MQNFDTYRMYNKKRRKEKIFFGLVVLTVLLLLVLIGHSVSYKDTPDKKLQKAQVDVSKYVTADTLDHHLEMVTYFHKIKSPSPQDMAVAVLSTKSPKLLAAMAKIETGGDYTKRNTGYKKRHHGAWQVNPTYWGAVSNKPVHQAIQAEKVLVALLTESNGEIRTALNKYGGDSTDAYSNKILAELESML